MNTENVGKYITAFFCCVGFIASPGLIIAAVILILICNYDGEAAKQKKKWQSRETIMIERYGKNYYGNPTYAKHAELARRQHYYRDTYSHQKNYEKYLGKRYEK